MDRRTATELGSDEQAAVVEAADDVQAFADPVDLGLDHIEYEVVALKSVVVDIIRAVETIAPGLFDKQLHTARLRLQQIEHFRSPAKYSAEDLVLAHRVDALERGLGRKSTRD